jgi:hypothetical protein
MDLDLSGAAARIDSGARERAPARYERARVTLVERDGRISPSNISEYGRRAASIAAIFLVVLACGRSPDVAGVYLRKGRSYGEMRLTSAL